MPIPPLPPPTPPPHQPSPGGEDQNSKYPIPTAHKSNSNYNPSGPIEAPKDDTLFHGQSRVYEGKMNFELERNPEVKKQLAEVLGKPANSQEVRDAIKEMEKILPGDLKRDGITREEINNFFNSPRGKAIEYERKKHEVAEISKGGVTQSEIGEMKREENVRNFFKGLFGLDKK